MDDLEQLCKELIDKNNDYQYVKTYKRHLRDMETLDKDKYRFNTKLAQMYILFMESFVHNKGPLANTPIKLEKWQIAAIMIAMGWEKYSEKHQCYVRRFNTTLWFMARKGGKTLLSAVLGIVDSILRVQWGSEIVCASTKRDQSMIAWTEIHKMIMKHKDLKKKYRKVGNKLFSKLDDGTVYTLGQDSSREDGLNISILILDEFHAAQNSGIYDVCLSSMGARKEPLTIIISTAGFNLASPLIQELEHGRKILNQEITDEDYFVFLAEPNVGDDPYCLETLRKSNPNMGVSVDEAFLIKEMESAKNRPDKRTNYLTKYVNTFVNSSEDFVKAEDWKKCRDDDRDISGAHTLIIGADLSISDDFTSITSSYMFPDDSIHVINQNWLPQQTIDDFAKKFRAPIDKWSNEGYITTSPKNFIDLDSVYEYIKKLIEEAEELGIECEVAYDAYRFKHLGAKLENELGFTDSFPVNQGAPTLNEPLILFKNYIREEKITYKNNPVLNWAVSNFEVVSDQYGNIKPDKSNRYKKIDAVAALVNTFTRIIPRILEPESTNEVIFL